MPRILVVDDKPDVLEVMCKWLALREYNVLSASSGAEAVRLASVESPDLILLDASMPGGGGIETSRTLRTTEQTRHVPVILVTGPDSVSGRIDAMMAGAHDFVTKPVSLDELNSRIHILLSGNGIPTPHDIPLPADVMQAVLSLLSCDLIWLFAVSTDGKSLINVSASTRWNPATAPSLQETIVVPLEPQAGRLARAAISRVAEFNLPSLGLSDFPRPVSKACQDLDLVSVSLIPLHHGKALLGVLLIGGRSNQDVDTPGGRQQIAAASNQVTMALENYRLAQRLSEVSKPASAPLEADRQTVRIWQVLENIQRSTSPDKALRAVLTQTATMLNGALATILLLTDRHSSELVVHAAAGLQAERLLGALIPRSGIAGAVVGRLTPVLENDARHDPHFMLGFDEQWGAQVTSILAAPLLIGGQAIGVMEVINKQSGVFDQADQDTLQGMAHLASLVIEQERLRAALAEHASIGRPMDELWLEPAETAEVASADILSPRPRQSTLAGLLDSLQGKADSASQTAGKRRLPSANELMGLFKDAPGSMEQTVQSRPTVDMGIKTEMSAADREAMGRFVEKMRANHSPAFDAPEEVAPVPPPNGERWKGFATAVSAESTSLYRSMASLENVAQSALDAVRSLAEQSGVDLVTFIEGYLPDIYIDKGRILDVIETLLEGAIKASSPAQHVKLAITDISGSLQVKISYQEAEIPLEDYPSIQQVIEQHKGHFEVTAEPNKGTAFAFTLPKAEITGMGDSRPAF